MSRQLTLSATVSALATALLALAMAMQANDLRPAANPATAHGSVVRVLLQG